MRTEADKRMTDQIENRPTDAHNSPVLSVVVPVRNDAPSVQVMVPILRAVIEVPNEVLVVYDDPADACVQSDRLRIFLVPPVPFAVIIHEVEYLILNRLFRFLED